MSDDRDHPTPATLPDLTLAEATMVLVSSYYVATPEHQRALAEATMTARFSRSYGEPQSSSR